MRRSPRFWLAAGVIFSIINVAGGVYAASMGEMMHASTHFLLLAGTVGLWSIKSGRRREADLNITSGLDPQLEQLQQSVDAIAIEVERIGEMQRYINKLEQEKAMSSSNETNT